MIKKNKADWDKTLLIFALSVVSPHVNPCLIFNTLNNPTLPSFIGQIKGSATKPDPPGVRSETCAQVSTGFATGQEA